MEGAQVWCLNHALHTSKRMHFIEEIRLTGGMTGFAFLHTSKRMHFIEDL